MSIKSSLRKLENLVKNRGGRRVSFEIPYCADKEKAGEIETALLKKHGLEGRKDVQVIFVLNYASYVP